MVVEKHLWNIYTSYEQSYLLFRSPVKIGISAWFRCSTFMVHTLLGGGVVQKNLNLVLNWTLKTKLIKEHNVNCQQCLVNSLSM